MGDKSEESSDILKFGHKNSPPIVDCEYYWGSWSNCSANCAGGERTQLMIVAKNPQRGGIACPTGNFSTEPCNEHPCPVDCVSQWGEWSGCSEVCGVGTRARILNIITQDDHGGKSCPEDRTETESCKVAACPVDCIYSWRDWTSCSVTCGDGTKTRTAIITKNPEGLGEIRVLVDSSTSRSIGSITLRLYGLSVGNLRNCATG